jgi:hypothetical protein
VTTATDSPGLQRFATPALFVLGAVIFVLLRTVVGVTFNATPLLVGLVVLAATGVRGRRASWGAGLVLTLVGIATLLLREGPLPQERESAAFLFAAGLGLLLALLVTAADSRADALIGGATATLLIGLVVYFAFDSSTLLGWPLWTAFLVLWAGWETRRAPTSGGG